VRLAVDVASEEPAELALQIDELKEADPGIGGELDQHVDVALGAEVRKRPPEVAARTG
jgi:hypothetical protein